MQTREATYKLGALDRELTETLLRRFWEKLLRDAAAAVESYCTPDVTFHILDAIPGAHGWIRAEGRQEVANAVAAINTSVEFLAFEIDTLIVDGEKAALRWHASFRHRGKGVVGEICFLDHITFSGGQISDYTVFMDTDSFRRLLFGQPQSRLAKQAHRRSAEACLLHPMPMAGSLEERDATEALLRNFWSGRLAKRNLDFDLLTDDAELCILGDPATLPMAQRFVGIDAIRALLQQVNIEFELLEFEMLDVLVEGNHAAIKWRADLKHRGTSARGLIEAADHVVTRHGKIASITRFYDTAGMKRWIAG